jgi:hypothetical protein
VAVATAAVVIAAPVQEPPLVVTPPPEEDETPDEDEIPDDEELPVDDDPADEDEPPIDRCGSVGVKCANLAPMTAAAAAESSPTRQVIFLTRRRPLSRAKAAFEYWVRLTASASRVILSGQAERPLSRVRITPCWPGGSQGLIDILQEFLRMAADLCCARAAA